MKCAYFLALECVCVLVWTHVFVPRHISSLTHSLPSPVPTLQSPHSLAAVVFAQLLQKQKPLFRFFVHSHFSSRFHPLAFISILHRLSVSVYLSGSDVCLAGETRRDAVNAVKSLALFLSLSLSLIFFFFCSFFFKFFQMQWNNCLLPEVLHKFTFGSITLSSPKIPP